jgi:hypothetical protein
MIINLNLERHCIETEIRQLHHQSMVAYFKNPSERNHLSMIIESLDQAIANWDFSALRSTYHELAGHVEIPVQLIADDTGEVALRIDGRKIQPILKA